MPIELTASAAHASSRDRRLATESEKVEGAVITRGDEGPVEDVRNRDGRAREEGGCQ